ncbi:HipA domain-containing protein [Candidatus Syntrophocurvum alkaliphilum]|nr:HipA domain-containing protein [Candidatus Syntrophocurvum alkaliphilum]
MIKDFSSWMEYEGASEGSGRSEKIWLVDPNNSEVGLFKFRKSEYTTEHLSEKIASEIAKLINIECMKVDLGSYNSRIGCISYKINNDNENLREGIQFINKYYPSYDPNLLYDNEQMEYYSLDMILHSLKEFDFQKEFLKIPIFDFLIGNTDRHQNNWAILQKGKSYTLCPLYDNASSLCCYIQESKIDGYLGNDKVRFLSLVDTKSTSRIRINKNIKKEPTHLEVLRFLRDNYYNDVIDIVQTINYHINENSLDEILEQYTADIVSKRRKILIKKFLIEKVNLMAHQFNLRKEE